MTKEELKQKIRALIPKVYDNWKKADSSAQEYDELSRFPELKNTVIDLLSHDYNSFLESIDWVAPKPTTFRMNLKNDYSFYLIYTGRTWIAQVEGKKYYLLNLPEEQRAIEAIARILKYGAKDEEVTQAPSEELEDTTLEPEEEIEDI
jgi:hypothetical protein